MELLSQHSRRGAIQKIFILSLELMWNIGNVISNNKSI